MEIGYEKDPRRSPADSHHVDPALVDSEQLSLWCRELNFSPHGTMKERFERIISHLG